MALRRLRIIRKWIRSFFVMKNWHTTQFEVIFYFIKNGNSQRIKSFQYIQKICEFMGIILSHSNRNYSLKPRIVLFYVPTAYMILEANSAVNFNNSFYINVTALSNFFTISLTIWKMPTILNVIMKLEKIIERSIENNLKSDLYENANK